MIRRKYPVFRAKQIRFGWKFRRIPLLLAKEESMEVISNLTDVETRDTSNLAFLIFIGGFGSSINDVTLYWTILHHRLTFITAISLAAHKIFDILPIRI
jgi:hypothetical protein